MMMRKTVQSQVRSVYTWKFCSSPGYSLCQGCLWRLSMHLAFAGEWL